MNKQEIVSVLAELNRITGFRVSLHGANYEEIAAYPEKLLPFCLRVQEEIGERIAEMRKELKLNETDG